MSWLAFALAAAVGAGVRSGLNEFSVMIRGVHAESWIANSLGCLMFGVFYKILPEHWNGLELRWILLAGLCGSLTTFSGLMSEVLRLFEAGIWRGALFYVFGCLFVGGALILAGSWIGKIILKMV
ncbi:MAG: hypothetical protein COT74_02760 [Bdellovibrionales bacterium CG10_big_fil_rev_8_21_14_0_10_45_34]|nr:MAG: hypothetical protein COT74_02760 [Bdellovibrionales bacterium CG10_big_fil_rev_8_21_14_0_10_45_34]